MSTKNRPTKPSHISKGNVLDDLGFSPEESAVIQLKMQLNSEIIKVVKKRKLTPRQVEKLLDAPQPRVSELLNGKISKFSSDKLTQYLYLLGRSVEVCTKPRPMEGTKAA